MIGWKTGEVQKPRPTIHSSTEHRWSWIRFKRNFWLAKYLTSRHVRMHKEIFYIPNTLRKLMIRPYAEVGNRYFIHSVAPAPAICWIYKRRYCIRYWIKIVASYRYRYSLPILLLHFKTILVLFYWRWIYFENPSLEFLFEKCCQRKNVIWKNSCWTVMI